MHARAAGTARTGLLPDVQLLSGQSHFVPSLLLFLTFRVRASTTSALPGAPCAQRLDRTHRSRFPGGRVYVPVRQRNLLQRLSIYGIRRLTDGHHLMNFQQGLGVSVNNDMKTPACSMQHSSHRLSMHRPHTTQGKPPVAKHSLLPMEKIQ